MLAGPETFFPSGCCPTSQNLPGRLHARAHVPALSQPASLECSAASSLRPRDSSSFHDCSKAAHAAWRELSFQCARPGAGDSGATYLGGELDPVHGVLGAVVVRGAPVQVELAEPVGPAERPAPQHCGGDAGSARPARAAPPRRRGRRAGPSLRAKAGALASLTEPGPWTKPNERFLPSALLICSFYYS